MLVGYMFDGKFSLIKDMLIILLSFAARPFPMHQHFAYSKHCKCNILQNRHFIQHFACSPFKRQIFYDFNIKQIHHYGLGSRNHIFSLLRSSPAFNLHQQSILIH